jgi:hypothetical protein
MAAKGKTCFVITPIGELGTEVRKRSDQMLVHVIGPAVTACGYQSPVRADLIAQPGMITPQVIEHLLDDDLVVADLTGHNANVFYELAVRHASRKPIVHIIEVGEPIPFDVAENRAVKVDHRDLDSVAKAIQELQEHVRSAEANPRQDNPITRTVDLRALRTSGDPSAERDAQILALLQEIRTSVNRVGAAEGSPTFVQTLSEDLDLSVRRMEMMLGQLERGTPVEPEAFRTEMRRMRRRLERFAEDESPSLIRGAGKTEAARAILEAMRRGRDGVKGKDQQPGAEANQ